MTRSEAIRRLAAGYGIEADYFDCTGVYHETGDATREKLLAALGVDLDGDLEALVEALETRDWRRPLPPVLVLRADAANATVELTLPADSAQSEWQWSLAFESGECQSGSFRPEALPPAGERTVDGTRCQRWQLPLPPLGIGYHRLELVPSAGLGTATQLIVTPGTCYRPQVLHGDGRAWGPTLQLYSLRSRRNWGIGDFTDLRAVVALAADAGAAMVGVNPLHALFPEQPERYSPYSPSSRLFLNVLYIDVEAVADFQASAAARALVAAADFQAQLARLRAAALVDYGAVTTIKLAALRLAFAEFRAHQLARNTPRAEAWRRFREAGGAALAGHALFEALQAGFRAADGQSWGWPAWPAEFRSPDAAAVAAYAAEHGEEIDFYIYLQWLAAEQLAAAIRPGEEGAPGLAIGLYQDLALGIDPGGAEAWGGQGWYARGAHLGAPPDDFSLGGQDWGLLPLLPQGLQETAYAPFIATLRATMRHAGALRIDHVMSLQRVFWVPAGDAATAGAYIDYPFDDLLGILALESQRHCCAVIGEDLGTVPEGFRAALAERGVLSYRPLFFERDDGGSFKAPAAYPRQALAVVATHDMATLYGYWQGSDIETRAALGLLAPAALEAAVVARAEDRARLLLALQREALLPEGIGMPVVAVPAMTAELALAVHAYLARSPAMLLGVQVEDIFGVVDQANLPGTVATHPNWRRRLPLELEAWSNEPRLRALADMLRGERRHAVVAAAPAPRGMPAPARAAEIPRATYRLQLNREFTLAQATAIVPYLAELGVSHCYVSPCLKARPGSSHGYDIVDYNAFNPEIGSDEDFRYFAATLQAHGMGLILDFVPNHMGVMGADNGWWLDVLENGPASVHAGYFDIDWQPPDPELRGKLMLPILGDHYGTVLERGELRLAFDAERGEFSLHYFGHRLPIDPAGYPRLLEHRLERLGIALGTGDERLLELQSLATAFGHLPARDDTAPDRIAERDRDKELLKRQLATLCAAVPAIAAQLADNVAEWNGGAPGAAGDAAAAADDERFDALHALIGRQAYRPAYWRVAADEINYRRFFDQNDLAAVRMENPEVFAACHRLVLSLVDAGLVQGLRIDHADGLYDPARYFRRLQAAAGGGEGGLTVPRRRRRLPLYLVIEKILAEGERLPEDWPIHGATGYGFANLVNGLFVDPAAEARMSRIYAEFTGRRTDFDELLYDAKKLIIRWSLQGELNVLASQLSHIAAASRHSCDFTLNGLRAALAEVVACFPVYRSYFAAGRLAAQDRRLIERAIGVAKRRSQAADISVFDFIRSMLTGEVAAGKSEPYRQQVWRFAMKFQQYTAAVMAKGMEDTAGYRYHRLLSLNEVGGDPRRFGVTLKAFHAVSRSRAQRWPHTLIAGSTHDSKRGEDVRARIDVLTEIPAAWKLALNRWRRLNRSKKRVVDGQPAPSRNDEYLIYQTLFGTWPLAEVDASALADYRQRIGRYLLKAVREAKEQSSWINVNEDYEAALGAFVEALLAPGEHNLFLADFVPATRRLAHFGLLNSLAQTLLRLTSPGVPDLYQGSELWQFNLVDPDNRRPVDFAVRRRLLGELNGEAADRVSALRELTEGIADGRIKLYLTWRALQLRRRWPEVFRDGDYLPLAASGRDAAHVCAYARQWGERAALTVVPRLGVKRCGGLGAAPAAWGDTRIDLPPSLAWRPWVNVLTGQRGQPAGGAAEALALDRLLEYFPVALLAIGPDALPEGDGYEAQ